MAGPMTVTHDPAQAAAAAEQPRPPAWTRLQLEHRLIAAAGEGNRVGQVDNGAAAYLLGVSTRTLRRWLHGAPDQVVGMSAKSRAAVWAALRPTEKRLEQERLDRRYAIEAVHQLALPKRRRRIPPAWIEQQWLDPHIVAILDLPYAQAHQIAFARMEGRPLSRLKNRGKMLDFRVVPTRFHATLLVGAVLEVVDPWRVVLARQWTKQGPGQGWMAAEAPQVSLDELAVTNDLP